MSIQQNFPAITPSLSLNFARSKKLDPRITFTRTSSATRTNETGLVEVVPANAPRFDHSYDPVSGSVKSLGLLVEEARSNLLLRSEEFDSASWNVASTPVAVTANTETSPSGNLTADTLANTGNANTEYRIVQFVTSSSQICFSVYVKEGTHQFLQFRTNNEASGFVNFDLSSISVSATTATGSILDAGFGWRRCSAVFAAASITSVQIQLVSGLGAVRAEVWTPTGTINIYIWGAQLEQGSFPTSYIPTTTSTATRTADNASITGSNFSDFYNHNEGSIFMRYRISQLTEFIPGVTGNTTFYIFMDTASEGTTSSFNKLQQFASIANMQNRHQVDGVNYSPVGFSPPPLNVTNVCGISYKIGTSQIAAYSNSNISFTTAPSTPNNISILKIGNDNTNSSPLNGHIAQLIYYPSRLPNDQLITLTK
jgi:hypothetical protein